MLGILGTGAGRRMDLGLHFISMAVLGMESTVEEHFLLQCQNGAVKLEFCLALCVKNAVLLPSGRGKANSCPAL